jgi:tetratricopeptide (TPR) repeat protein
MNRRLMCLAVLVGLLGAGLAACHERRPGAAVPEPAVSGQPEIQAKAAGKHAALGDDYYQRRRQREALAEWRLALALDPTRRDLREKIKNLENGGSPALGGPDAPDPDLGSRISLTLALAEKNYQASRLKEAELAYRDVLLLDPGQGEAQTGLARLQAEVYAPDAQRAYDQVTASLYAEGMHAYRQRDWDQASAKLQEAAKLNPEQPQVKKFLAAAQAEAAGLRDRARALALVAQAQQAEGRQDWLQAFSAWQEAGRMHPPAPEAAEGVRRAGREMEKLAAGHLARARQSLDAGNYTSAREGFEKVLALFPGNAEAENGVQQARGALTQQQASRGSRAEAQKLYNRGVEAYRRGDLTQAVSAWEGAHAADPQDAGIRDALGRAQKEQAETRAKNRRLGQMRYEDGLAAYQRGELDEALAAWRETLELDPEHAKARANLKRVEQEMK